MIDPPSQIDPHDDGDPPLSAAQERFLRRVRLIGVVGALIIFIGFGVVIATILLRLGASPAVEIPEAADAVIVDTIRESQVLRPGERIASAVASGGWLTVVVMNENGPGRVLVFDLETLTLRRELKGEQAAVAN